MVKKAFQILNELHKLISKTSVIAHWYMGEIMNVHKRLNVHNQYLI